MGGGEGMGEGYLTKVALSGIKKNVPAVFASFATQRTQRTPLAVFLSTRHSQGSRTAKAADVSAVAGCRLARYGTIHSLPLGRAKGQARFLTVALRLTVALSLFFPLEFRNEHVFVSKFVSDSRNISFSIGASIFKHVYVLHQMSMIDPLSLDFFLFRITQGWSPTPFLWLGRWYMLRHRLAISAQKIPPHR